MMMTVKMISRTTCVYIYLYVVCAFDVGKGYSQNNARDAMGGSNLIMTESFRGYMCCGP